MKGIYILLFAIIASMPTVAQSVNAYYDAVHLSQITGTKDAAENKKIISILAAYANKNNSFDTKEITDIYTAAVKNIFSLETLFAWFTKPCNAYANNTGTLCRYITEHKDLKRKLDINENTASSFNTLFSKDSIALLLRLETADSGLHDAAYRKKITAKLVNQYSSFTGLKEKLDNIKTADSTFDFTLSPATAWQIIDDIRYQQNAQYTAESERLSNDLSKQTSLIQNYFATNYNFLDADLRDKFYKKEKLDGKQLAALNSHIASQAFNADNSFSEALYHKNETGSLTNFKLPSQTEMIDALAIYLAKRFKQEIALTLVDQFRKTLKNDRLLNDLFPETYKMFKSGELFEMPSFGSAWNYAISKDFTNMLVNLSHSTVIKEKIGDTILVNHLQNIIKLSSLINKQYSYVDAVSQMYYQNESNNFFSKNIRSLQIINKELFDTGKASQFWINAESLYALNEPKLNLFYALLKEKYNNDLGVINAGDLSNPEMKPRIRNMMSSMLVLLNNFQASRRNMMAIQGGATNVQASVYWDFLMSLFETLQSQQNMQLSPYVQKFINITNHCFETYAMLSEKNYSGAALKLMDILPEIRDNNYVDLEAICFSGGKLQKLVASSTYSQYVPVREQIDKLNKLVKNYLFIRDFKKEVNEHSSDYRYLLNDQRIIQLKQQDKKLKMGAFMTNLLQRLNNDSVSLHKKIDSTAKAIQALISRHKELNGVVEIRLDFMANKILNGPSAESNKYILQSGASQFESIRKITGFLSDVVLAGNSKNLSQIIEKYALPPNSYKIKRHTRSSWDVNAYVGAYIGGEVLTSGKHAISPVYGFSAPIGVSYSWGKTAKAKSTDEKIFYSKKGNRVLKGNSVSVNLSLIDIGAVVSYRLTNDASKGLPQQVKWSQLISPGLHLRWGIKESPICFSFGVQSTPQLRRLNTILPPVSAVRTYAGFFFDIPLFNVSHR